LKRSAGKKRKPYSVGAEKRGRTEHGPSKKIKCLWGPVGRRKSRWKAKWIGTTERAEKEGSNVSRNSDSGARGGAQTP